jgi:hypothetical protein
MERWGEVGGAVRWFLQKDSVVDRSSPTAKRFLFFRAAQGFVVLSQCGEDILKMVRMSEGKFAPTESLMGEGKMEPVSNSQWYRLSGSSCGRCRGAGEASPANARSATMKSNRWSFILAEETMRWFLGGFCFFVC